MDNKWRFAPNNNAGLDGINDAGIETFSSNYINSLVREAIQNSLDAKNEFTEDPVEVHFNLFQIPVKDIPDYEGLSNSIHKCLLASGNDVTAKEFFTRAKKIMDGEKISVMRISDYNTVGLEGSENPMDIDSNWFGLVKKDGSSNNKNGSSGGSFGIGKNAYFGASDIRTVFFTSLNKNNHKSNIGLAKLISFKEDSYWTIGKGYYSNDERFLPIEEILSLDPNYQRTDMGTDIYILGMNSLIDGEEFEEIITRQVLLNFFISIWTKQLVVKVQDKRMDLESLEIDISNLNDTDDKEIKELKEYYYLLTSEEQEDVNKVVLNSDEFGKEYGFEDGECILYVKKSNTENLNRKVLLTRKTGMRLFEKGNINGHIKFTAVMHIIGQNMNRVFREMEVPSHDAWEPGRCRGKAKAYAKIQKEFYKYIKDKVNDIIKEDIGVQVDAFNVSDYIKDYTDTEKTEVRKYELTTKVKEFKVKKINQREVKKKKNLVEALVDETEENVGLFQKKNHSESNEGSGKGNPQELVGKENETSQKQGYKEIRIPNQMLIGLNVSKGHFLYKFQVPRDSLSSKISFNIIGEQKLDKLKIKNAEISNCSSAKVRNVDGNVIYLDDLKKSEDVEIHFTTDFKYNCSMEVIYYESK